jgi:hypothetical protein
MALKELVSPSVGVQGAPLGFRALLDLQDQTGALVALPDQ